MWTKAMKVVALVGIVCMLAAIPSLAVTPEEAAQLKTTLTPMGAEKAGNAAGTIPAWTGGMTSFPVPYKNGGRRPDPFANEKPLFSITAKNMGQYADKLTEGTQAMLKKYPEDFRVDVYQTHRTAAAPKWVYDNIFKNATRAKMVDTPAVGPYPQGAYGGIPFPIPKTGAEVIWNGVLDYKYRAYHVHNQNYLIPSNGKSVLVGDAVIDQDTPYYDRNGSAEKFDGFYTLTRVTNLGPPIRAGEAIIGKLNWDDSKTETWVYLTGQRRTRKLPQSCCDTPNPVVGGLMSFDEFYTFNDRLSRFTWKILGKKEMYIPYNSNRTMVPTKNSDIIKAHFMNPDYVRWELHRVWVVEANLAPGQRHVMHKSIYYLDEDSWFKVMGDRWDSSGRLWKMVWTLPTLLPMPDGTLITADYMGYYELLSGSWAMVGIMNELPEQGANVPPHNADYFAAEALAQAGLR